MDLKDIEKALWGTGLISRGGFHPGPDDLIPEAAGDVGTVVVVGNAGEAMWQVFSASAEYARRDRDDHTLNAWTERVLSDVAAALGARVVFPFGGPPYHPFQRWAQKADSVFASPIGPLIHPVYGLWHAYRGALLIAERFDLPARAPVANPCESCPDRPCLTTCPVDAFSEQGYAVPRCVAHLQTAEGADCIEAHCRARRACPVGRTYQYVAEQAAFHQNHFLRARLAAANEEPGF